MRLRLFIPPPPQGGVIYNDPVNTVVTALLGFIHRQGEEAENMDDRRHFSSGSNPDLGADNIHHCGVFAEETREEPASNCSEM